MDILVSSNLERLLYLVSQDASCVERLMRELNTQGWYQVSGWMLEQLRAVFGCGCCDDAGAAEVIGRVWREHKYLCDPHTAVAWAVAEKHTREGVPMVVLSTASPYKFPAAVLHALGEASGDDEFAMMEQLHALTGMDIPKISAAWRAAPSSIRRHRQGRHAGLCAVRCAEIKERNRSL